MSLRRPAPFSQGALVFQPQCRNGAHRSFEQLKSGAHLRMVRPGPSEFSQISWLFAAARCRNPFQFSDADSYISRFSERRVSDRFVPWGVRRTKPECRMPFARIRRVANWTDRQDLRPPDARDQRWRELLQRGQLGDRDAYRELLESLVPRIRELIDCADGLDEARAVESVLLAVHRSRHTFRPEYSFSRWLHSIAGREMRREIRRTTGRSRLPESPNGSRGETKKALGLRNA